MPSLRSMLNRSFRSSVAICLTLTAAFVLTSPALAQRGGNDAPENRGGGGDDGGLAGVVGAPTGACCIGPNGGCVTVTHPECDALQGFYMGDDTDCSVCLNTGRCCIYQNGLPSCEVVTLWDCSQNPDWAYWQPGANCDTACEPRGACCGDGFCYITPQFLCEFYSDRVYIGDDTTCDDCGQLGACCTGLGCTQTLEENCSGTFMGSGTACNPCPPPSLGMCCLGPECVIWTQSDCESNGGTFFGAGVNCGADYACGDSPEVGACCIDGACISTIESICLLYGGTFDGIGSNCEQSLCELPVTGMCCIESSKAGASCLILTQVECFGQSGVYYGDGVPCDTDYFCGDLPEAGACCLPSGTCMFTTETICGENYGTFAGIGVLCGDVNCSDYLGACCLQSGSCLFTTEFHCSQNDGSFSGMGVLCQDVACGNLPGACCYDSGTACSEMLEADCLALGGTFAGINTFCDNNTCPGWLGKCCLQDPNGNSFCLTSTIDECFQTPGAVWWGIPGVCEDSLPPGLEHCPPFGACCLPNGSCQVLDENLCINFAGGVFKGLNTTCADIDQNGKAERCEKPGDTDANGVVNVTDLLAVISAWGTCPPPCPADVFPIPNGDGIVNVSDLLTVISNWG